MTAVEFLESQYNFNKQLFPSDFEQAKEMDKEQVVDAFFQGVDRESDGHGVMYLSRKDAEQYYNEKFKSE